MIRTNMSIEVESAMGMRVIPLETRLLSQRKVFLSGEINMEMADDFAQQMMYLKESKEAVQIYLNSHGGEVDAGLMIYDVIRSAGSLVSICCTGRAYSMAAILLASAPKGKRSILPHSKVMIHEPLIPGGIGGSASSIKKISDSMMKTRKLTIELLMEHTGKKKSEVEKSISYDHFMDAKEAIAFGICDRIEECL